MRAMKVTITVIVLMPIAVTFAALTDSERSQPPSPLDAVEFEQKLKNASREEAYELVQVAFSHHDIHLLEKCMKVSPAGGYVMAEYQNADEEVKALIALLILRREDGWVKREGVIYQGGTGLGNAMAVGTIEEVVAARVPGMGPLADIVKDEQRRLDLVDRLEATFAPQKLETKATETKPAEISEVGKQSSSATTVRNVGVVSPTASQPTTPSQWLLWILAVVVGLVGMALFIKRKSED